MWSSKLKFLGYTEGEVPDSEGILGPVTALCTSRTLEDDISVDAIDSDRVSDMFLFSPGVAPYRRLRRLRTLMI